MPYLGQGAIHPSVFQPCKQKKKSPMTICAAGKSFPGSFLEPTTVCIPLLVSRHIQYNFHRSIRVFFFTFLGPGHRSQGQRPKQKSSDLPLPSHLVQLGSPSCFHAGPRNIISFGLSRGLFPIGHTWNTSPRGHACLAPFNVKEKQLYLDRVKSSAIWEGIHRKRNTEPGT